MQGWKKLYLIAYRNKKCHWFCQNAAEPGGIFYTAGVLFSDHSCAFQIFSVRSSFSFLSLSMVESTSRISRSRAVPR